MLGSISCIGRAIENGSENRSGKPAAVGPVFPSAMRGGAAAPRHPERGRPAEDRDHAASSHPENDIRSKPLGGRDAITRSNQSVKERRKGDRPRFHPLMAQKRQDGGQTYVAPICRVAPLERLDRIDTVERPKTEQGPYYRAGEVGARFGCWATDSVHQQAVWGGCMRRCPANILGSPARSWFHLQPPSFAISSI